MQIWYDEQICFLCPHWPVHKLEKQETINQLRSVRNKSLYFHSKQIQIVFQRQSLNACVPALIMPGNKEHTFFFSSTEIALASLRNMAFPQRSSRKEVNWWYFHFLNAHAASWYSRSLQLHSASNKGLTEMPSGNHSQTTTQSMTQRKEIKVLNIAKKYFNEILVLGRMYIYRCNRHLAESLE